MSEKTQVEFLEEILRLKKENPDREIRFCVASRGLAENMELIQHRITQISLGPVFERGKEILINEADIREHFKQKCSAHHSWFVMKRMVDAMYDDKVRLAICVFLNAD